MSLGRPNLYKVTYSCKIQYGTWHSHDDLEITGYSKEPKVDSIYIAAPDEIYVKAWWELDIRYEPKQKELTLISIEQLASDLKIIRTNEG